MSPVPLQKTSSQSDAVPIVRMRSFPVSSFALRTSWPLNEVVSGYEADAMALLNCHPIASTVHYFVCKKNQPFSMCAQPS